jgi:proteasome lid subunit RPN8/RPN11
MTLRLNDTLLDRLRHEGERSYPGECCGVLAGRPGNANEVLRLLPVENQRTDDPHRYLIGSDDLRRIEAEVGRMGLEVLGFYHSHPDHPAVPSRFDLEHAWPWYSYVILRVERGSATEAASWQLSDDRSSMQPETLDVFSEV